MIESISFARGRGVVSAKWLGHVREVQEDTLNAFEILIHICDSGSPTPAEIHRGFLHSDPRCWSHCLRLCLLHRTFRCSFVVSDLVLNSPA